jgi:hypothetical protein
MGENNKRSEKTVQRIALCFVFIDKLRVAMLRRMGWANRVKVKVKFTVEQATKAQRGSRSIAILFL